MELCGKSVSLEKCAMHVAPGGSVVIALVGAPKTIGSLLCDLREEIACGLVSVETCDADVKVEIYFGKADVDYFNEVVSKNEAAKSLKLERREIDDGSACEAMSMATRNQVINALC